jgi:2-hydroxyacyl-CoA lyase 1
VEKALSVLESAVRPLVIVGKGMAMPMPRDLRGALDEAMAFRGRALVNVKLHREAARKTQQFGWLTT